MSLRCCFGFHDWKQSREITPDDYTPFSMNPRGQAIRICTRCGRAQYWLPGYGGSGIGGWVNTEYETPTWKVVLITLFVIAFFVFLCVAPILCLRTSKPPLPPQVEKP